jgi:cell division transport system ATP-binding protein
VIHFDNVTKTYPNQSRPALENVTLDVEKGEFVFLVGPSGSGKSTFLRLVLKEERPTEGRIHVAGKDLARLTNWKVPHLRRRIGCVFQDFRLLPSKNVYQNIAFALEVIGKPRRFIRKVVPEVIDLVGLEGKRDRMPDELSGGEQQRVAMARAFVNRPMILLADEPTGNIDPATSIGIMKVSSTGSTGPGPRSSWPPMTRRSSTRCASASSSLSTARWCATSRAGSTARPTNPAS